MSNGHAPKGGAIGLNGERYEGGQFLPSTTQPKKSAAKRERRPRKVQIERYVWVEIPSDRHWPIYSMIVGAQAQENGGVVSRFEPGCTFYGEQIVRNGIDFGHVDNLITKFNAGERWIEITAAS